MRSSTIVLLLSALLLGCSGEESGERSSSTNQTEISTTVEDTSQVREPVATEDSSDFVADSKPTPEIKFEREKSFGSTDEVIVGSIETFTVDDSGRVFIAGRDQTTIHVYNPDGSYNTSLGREGKGPGEFAVLTSNTTIEVYANHLYVTDLVDALNYFPHRMNIFSLEDLSLSHTIKLLAKNKKEYEELERHSPKRFYPRSDGTFLVSYHRSPNEYQDSLSLIRYVIQDSTGTIISDPILEQKDLTYLVFEVTDAPRPYLAVSTFPFFEKSLLDVSKDGHIYAVNNIENFKINVYDNSGQQIRTFEHSFNNKPFNESKVLERYEETNYMSELGDGVALKMIREADNLPEIWPALETMFFDDENRLWISTIVEDNEIYEWWVLEDTGVVIAKFNWPRDKPIEEIKNGKIYARETEEETGLEKIVRYDIKINKK